MTPITIPIKKVVLVFQILILVMVACKHQDERKCLLFWDSIRFDDQIEALNGDVKDVIIGDSLLKSSHNQYDHVHFDKKGNMISLHEIHQDEDWRGHPKIVDLKVVYHYTYNKTGQKKTMTGTFEIEPDSAGRELSTAKWNFDSLGHIIDYKPLYKYNFFQYKYNTLGRLQIKTLWWKIPLQYKYIYDIENRLKQIEEYQPDWPDKKTLVNRTTFEYQAFDSHKNWTKKTLHFGLLYPQIPHTDKNTIYLDTPPHTITRKITYY